MNPSSAENRSEQFRDYETFRDWLYSAFPEDASNTARGTTFLEFVMSLLPETARGRRFGLLKASPKHSHDRGVDAVNADDDHPDPIAIQSKLTIGEKADLDSIFSKWQAYESALIDEGPLELVPLDDTPRRPTYVLATSQRLEGLLPRYEATDFASRPFYRKLKAEQRLLIWDGNDLLDDARQVETRRFSLPVEVEITSEKGWLELGSVRIGVLRARDLALLEEKHGPGLFFENVRGWKGLDPVKDGETVNEAIRDTVLNAPADMLARNNGVTFRAAKVIPKGNLLVLEGGSIVNGRQTTGCISAAGPGVSHDCLVNVKVVESQGDAWRIAEAANNQNAVAY